MRYRGDRTFITHLSMLASACLVPSNTGMSVSVPLITDPRDQLLGALPFVHARARNQCYGAIRRAFDDTTGEQTSVQVMLHLATRNGPTLMEMIANVVRNESELLVILTGREVESSLAGLLHNEGSTTESAVAVSESNNESNANGCDADEEHFRSASEVGSIKDGDAGDDETGQIFVLETSNDGVCREGLRDTALASGGLRDDASASDSSSPVFTPTSAFVASAQSTLSGTPIINSATTPTDTSVMSSSTMTTPTGTSVMSSLTMPTLSAPSKAYSGSSVSSLTMSSHPAQEWEEFGGGVNCIAAAAATVAIETWRSRTRHAAAWRENGSAISRRGNEPSLDCHDSEEGSLMATSSAMSHLQPPSR